MKTLTQLNLWFCLYRHVHCFRLPAIIFSYIPSDTDNSERNTAVDTDKITVRAYTVHDQCFIIHVLILPHEPGTDDV